MQEMLASAHMQYVASCRSTFAKSFYHLSSDEIKALEVNGNSAENWGLVRKTKKQLKLQTNRIRQCSFHGKVVLGDFSDFQHDVDGVPFPCGVYNSTLSDVVVLDDALVKDTLVLKGVLVDAKASVLQCGSVVCAQETETVFGNGRVLHVGVETGGRNLRVVADLPFSLGAEVATKRGDLKFLETYDAIVDEYVAKIKAPMAIVAQNAQERTVVKTKSVIRDSIVQWNSTVETLSVVEGSFLCDTSHVERHGVVMSSVIGPNTSIAEGEVTSSFVGPFVGFHHQALLIASIWPKGKGNIGYGANVGSNHTLKAPDQELFHGEGMFFGLGCNVKFPSNFVKAPYSVIATAVNTLPQLMTMPFALINTPAHVIPSLSPAINEISPGWVLSSSVYTVLRNDNKFRSRNKSKRTHIEAAIFRPEIVQYMKEARADLEAAEGKARIQLANGEAVYTDKQVRGLGKNYMREASRRAGIEAYTFFIKLYALDALLPLVEGGSVSADGTVGNVDRSLYELATLSEEVAPEKLIRECLNDLTSMRTDVVNKAAGGKARDDARGQGIIPDYKDVHPPAASEEVILQAQRTATDIKHRVAAFVARV
ncbi:hypothetical protein JM16_006513 [Phytophthora kernoviae]|uniref:DUF4954 domain-containing protein n=1 Tax=Phytophthora kernoviae TaxID=325452 RepID=A0A8T0LV23_9STRA|nr:hypothetical protein JM16_006513 [Phytophthora kernoviae]